MALNANYSHKHAALWWLLIVTVHIAEQHN